MKKVILLALDDRPCSYKYFNYICLAFGIQHSICYSYNELLKHKNAFDTCFIISLDNFLFDGIVNSRNLEVLKSKRIFERLKCLLDFIDQTRKCDFYIYSSIPRILLNFGANLEKIIQTNKVWYEKFCQFAHNLLDAYERYNEFDNDIEKYIFLVRKTKLEIIEYFLSSLSKMDALNVMKQVKEILLCIDDSQIRGLNFLEANYLLHKYDQRGKYRLSFLIGLDEIHLLILSKVVLTETKSDIKKLPIFYSPNFSNKISIYEGEKVDKVIERYEEYLGVKFSKDDDSQFFWKLFRGKYQKESMVQVIKFRIFQKFIEYFCDLKVVDLIPKSFNHFIDTSFANGVSLKTLKFFLANWNRLLSMNSFWGWNTLANTLGSGISFYVISQIIPIKRQYYCSKLTVENFFESLYQTTIRYFAKRENWTVEKINQAFKLILNKFDIDVEIDLRLPWNRYFEIDVNYKGKGNEVWNYVRDEY
ncbi:MAG: DUF4127 family protein [bacterium]